MAIGVQTLLVLLMLATSTFETVLVYAQFSILACSFLTVLGVRSCAGAGQISQGRFAVSGIR